jgi:hypothetical protein
MPALFETVEESGHTLSQTSHAEGDVQGVIWIRDLRLL